MMSGARQSHTTPRQAQVIEHTAPALRAAVDAQRQLTAARGGLARRDDAHLRRERPQQPLHEARQGQRLGAQPLDAGLGEDRERGDERCGGEDRRVADLPGIRPERRPGTLAPCESASAPRVPTSPRAARRATRRCDGCALRARVPLVHEAAADRPGTAVQILVAAPHGEVGRRRRAARAAYCRWSAPGRIRRSHPAMRGARDARQIERLAGAELHAGPQHQRDLLAVPRQACLDRRLVAPGPRRRAARAR